jgi:hypothetical protein
MHSLRAWQSGEAAKEAARGVPLWLDRIPETWLDDPHWFCPNGHVSGVYLKSEERGDLCLACMEPVMLGPKIGEQAFSVIMKGLP